MSGRRTYTEGRPYAARVMKWRLAIYAPRKLDGQKLQNGCRVLLLRLSDDMKANGEVSVPRSVLARDLGVAPARITEWIAMAIDFDLLDCVVKGRPGVTSVYSSKIPPREVRPGVPSKRYARADQAEVRPGVPSKPNQRYATAGTHEVGTDGAPAVCPWHEHDICPADCANYVTGAKRRTA